MTNWGTIQKGKTRESKSAPYLLISVTRDDDRCFNGSQWRSWRIKRRMRKRRRADGRWWSFFVSCVITSWASSAIREWNSFFRVFLFSFLVGGKFPNYTPYPPAVTIPQPLKLYFLLVSKYPLSPQLVSHSNHHGNCVCAKTHFIVFWIFICFTLWIITL